MMILKDYFTARQNVSPTHHVHRIAAQSLLLLVSGVFALLMTAAHAATPRIVNGFKLPIVNASATVALLERSRVELDGDLAAASFCGGALIGPRWVVTAAHCMFNPDGTRVRASELMVLAGSNDLDNPASQPIRVSIITLHENYTDVNNGFDIALLRLAVNANAIPIPMDVAPVTPGEKALSVGWGSTSTFSTITREPQLRAARMIMTPGELCTDWTQVDETQICASPDLGKGGPCRGDSGNALYRVVDNGVKATTLVGITSFAFTGDECSGTGLPLVYTNIGEYETWIFNNSGIRAPAQYDPVRTGIKLSGSGWWQIQRNSDYLEMYQGLARGILLPAGVYKVTNLTTGYKARQVRVRTNEMTLVDSEGPTARKGINLTGEGWWQVQDSKTYVEFYQGRSKFVTLRPGSYNVINFTTGVRRKNVIVR